MFKDKLKQLRIERNLTQAELAKAIGVSAATIGNYEQGTREPRNNEMWQKLAEYFNVSIDYLMDKETKYIPLNQRVLDIEDSESPKRDRFNQFRTDIPIIYDDVDITTMVHAKIGEAGRATKEQRYAYVEFNSRSGHVLFARNNLLAILSDIKSLSKQEIISSLKDITERINLDVVYWYNRCWNNISDIFPKATNLETLFDLLNKCLCVDMIAETEFSLVPIQCNYDWLREKLR